MIKLADNTIDKQDINSLCNWLQQDAIPQLTKGPLTIKYETDYAKRISRKYAVFVNSGSSANLISIYSLIVSERLKNNKVIIPAVSWITTISPILQFGLQPILCDVNLNNLSVDLNHLEFLFKNENPSLLIIVSVLGLLPDIKEIINLCDKYDVLLMMDNCESQGSKYNGIQIESFGLISTCSSYFGHITSTIEGGMIVTDDSNLYRIIKSLRSHGWTREWDKWESDKFNYTWNIDSIESMYTFYYPSFNCRNTEIAAFLGLKQLEKLDYISDKRYNNYKLFNDLIDNKYWKPLLCNTNKVSNLGYPIITDKRHTLIKALIKNNIECRPLISGSMGRQPFWIERYGRQEMMNASLCHTAGLYVPNHAHISFENIEYIVNVVNSITCG